MQAPTLSTPQQVPTILLVDDSKEYLYMMQVALERSGYNALQAEDGVAAIHILTQTPHLQAVILDRKMPGIDGMEVLRFIKDSPSLQHLPVIFQTGLVQTEHVLEGMRAGCYYYLTKPYDLQLLPAIIHAAIQDSSYSSEEDFTIPLSSFFHETMQEARFRIQTLQDAKYLAFLLASCFPDRKTKYYGLSELLINAIEHGNLGITYEEKRYRLLRGTLATEIERRFALADNKTKAVTVTFERTESRTTISIADEGVGFDWTRYLHMSPDRVTDPNGRGIAVYAVNAFTKLEYHPPGNLVVCTQVHDK